MKKIIGKNPLRNKKYANFIISFKLILWHKGKVLILTESNTNFLDLPGGRADKGEETLAIEKIIKREIIEELGRGVKYKILKPAIQYRRYNQFKKVYTFITAYEAKYLSGKIKLSPEHQKYEWINPKKQNLKNRAFNNKEEKEAFLNYFNWK